MTKSYQFTDKVWLLPLNDDLRKIWLYWKWKSLLFVFLKSFTYSIRIDANVFKIIPIHMDPGKRLKALYYACQARFVRAESGSHMLIKSHYSGWFVIGEI